MKNFQKIFSTYYQNIARISFYLSIVLILSIFGCASSPKFPSITESQQKIKILTPKLDSLDRLISAKVPQSPAGFDIFTRFKREAMNRILSAFAQNRTDDITIDFLPTRPLWKEDKSVLGMTYSNYVDVESGTIAVNLKSFRFDKFDANGADASIELEGTGNIGVSGKYTGIPASATPNVQFYLFDQVHFDIFPTDSDYVILKPQPKMITLKTKISISLLKLELPYYREIPLQVADLIKPVSIPAALTSDVQFPVPASKFGGQKYEFAPRKVKFSKTAVSINNDALEFKANVNFVK